jgi:uncharacterized membrane protein
VGLLSRAAREFAVVPLGVTAGFAFVAVLAVVGDQSHAQWLVTTRKAVGHVMGNKASASTLQAVATGLVTVTSITFSVLLLAVQQTASNLSPVVFDQFLRRRANQVYLGFFVGLALFAYVTMATVQDDTPPIIGAAIAMLLTIVALILLLGLVYSTLNQMRPANVLRHIHDRAHAARHREATLLTRTRRRGTSTHPVSATYRSSTNGYVVGIDLDRLVAGLARIPSAEIDLRVTVGEHVAYGDPVATVRDDDDADAEWLANEVRSAVLMGSQRDIDQDATTGIDELVNIAWTAGSTAKQNPATACEAVDSIKDLAARWLTDDPVVLADSPVAVVYPDRGTASVLDALRTVMVAAHESHQVTLAVHVLDAYRSLIGRVPEDIEERLRHDLQACVELAGEMPPSPALDRARQFSLPDSTTSPSSPVTRRRKDDA